jgi:hypothetical protein
MDVYNSTMLSRSCPHLALALGPCAKLSQHRRNKTAVPPLASLSSNLIPSISIVSSFTRLCLSFISPSFPTPLNP